MLEALFHIIVVIFSWLCGGTRSHGFGPTSDGRPFEDPLHDY